VLENACRHGDAATPIQISTSDGGGTGRVEVSSGGAAIPTAVMDGFVSPAPTERAGLGLSIVRWIATVHGGRPAYPREPGVNTFVLELSATPHSGRHPLAPAARPARDDADVARAAAPEGPGDEAQREGERNAGEQALDPAPTAHGLEPRFDLIPQAVVQIFDRRDLERTGADLGDEIGESRRPEILGQQCATPRLHHAMRFDERPPPRVGREVPAVEAVGEHDYVELCRSKR